MSASETRIPCSTETREKYLKPLKRGGETYDDLLRKMAEQYEPGTTAENEASNR
jgi:hypothetical protein